MTESATPNEFTPHDALAALAEARAFEEPLRQRTEGLTWMIWGFATAGIFLSYHAASLALDGWPWWTYGLWAPWVLAGNLATRALWSTAALAAPRIATGTSGAAYAWLACGIALLFGWALTLYAAFDQPGATTWVLAVGTMWAGVSAFDFFRASRRGRLVGLVVGTAFALLGIGMAVAGLPEEPASVLAVVAGGLVPFTGGAFQALAE